MNLFQPRLPICRSIIAVAVIFVGGIGSASAQDTPAAPPTTAEHQTPTGEGQLPTVEPHNSTSIQNPYLSPRDPYAALHLNLLANPRIGINFGLDVAFPRLSIARGWLTRIDADVLTPFDTPSFLGQPGTQVELTLNQVRYGGGRVGKRFYGSIGAGGFYYRQIYQFGAKLTVGQEITPVIGVEAGLHLPVASQAQFTAGLRIAL